MRTFLRKKNFRSVVVLIFLLLTNPPVISRALGAVDNTTNGLALDTSKLPSTPTDCDATCNMFGESSPGYGLSGSGSWGTQDDQYCANHGSVTNTSVGPSSTSGCQAQIVSDCNVPYCKGNESCQTANSKLIHCKLQNSQAQSYCSSYLQAKNGKDYNFVSVALDAAATSFCGIACVMEVTPEGSAAAAVCGLMGGAAAIAEIVATSQLQGSDLAKTISFMAGAAGLGASAVNLKTGLGDTVKTVLNKAAKAKADKEVEKTAEKGALATAKEGSFADKAKGMMKNKEACATAMLFGIMTGMRMYNIQSIQGTMDSSCKSLQGLISSATTASTATTDINSSNYTPINGITNFGGGSASGGSSTNSSSGGGDSTPIPLFTPCSSSSGQSSQCPNWGSSAAMDSGILSKANALPTIAPVANHLADSGLQNQIASGATAGQIVGGAMGGGGGSFGQALASLADQVQQNPQDAMALLPEGALPMMTSGGGGGKGRSGSSSSNSKGENPFASLFGQGAKKDAGPVSAMNFGGAKVSDIWHTGVKMSIFDIVSQRVLQVTFRTQL